MLASPSWRTTSENRDRRRGSDGLCLRRAARCGRQRRLGGRHLGGSTSRRSARTACGSRERRAIARSGSARRQARQRSARSTSSSSRPRPWTCALRPPPRIRSPARRPSCFRSRTGSAAPMRSPRSSVPSGRWSASRAVSVPPWSHPGTSATRGWSSCGSVSAKVLRRSDSSGSRRSGATAGFNVKTYDDVGPLVWEKLICNACFSGTCAILDRTIGEVLDRRERVGRRPRGVPPRRTRLREPSRIDLSFEDPVEYARAFGLRIPQARPSVLLDLTAGRRCEIDVINGAVPRVGRSVGVAAPVNETVTALVKALEAGCEPGEADAMATSRDPHLVGLHLTVLPHRPADGRAARAPVRRRSGLASLRPAPRIPGGGHIQVGAPAPVWRSLPREPRAVVRARRPRLQPTARGRAELARRAPPHRARSSTGEARSKRTTASCRATGRRPSNIGDPDVLHALAAELGLESAADAIEGDEYGEEVARATATAYRAGINSIPAFLLDRRLIVLGAQADEVFAQAFAELGPPAGAPDAS